MDDRSELFIGGRWVQPRSSARYTAVSPSSEDVLATVPLAATDDIDDAVEAARSLVDSGAWSSRSVDDRADGIARLRIQLAARTDELADAISAEVGTPRTISPMTQVGMALGVFEAYEQFTRVHPWSDERTGRMGSRVVVRRLPVGVVGAIVPWNAPLFAAALKLGPALGAGNAVVLKPALQASLHSFILSEAIAAADLPAGLVSVVPCGPDAAEHLVRHPGVDKVSFTGSTAVGRRIGAICAADLRRCTLELGGKSAAIVLDDVVLDDDTVRGLLGGIIANAGQVCAAQTRVLAPRGRYDEVVDALASAADAVQVGDAFEPSTAMGPLISERQRDRIEDEIADAVRQGARIAAGGERPDGAERGWFLRPTILADVTNDMAVARQELFAPVGVVIPHDGDDDAVRLANDSPYGLAGRVWTADPDRGHAVASQLRVGSASLNTLPPIDLAGPFGGFKDSGFGREGGPEGFEAYVESQTLVLPGR